MRREFTPLPKVAEMTEGVVVNIDTLGLPVGLDPETIGMNVHAVERARRLCDSSFLMIIGTNIDEDEVDLMGQVGADGALAATKAMTRKATNDISENIGLDKEYIKSSLSLIALNNGLRNSRVQETADLFDPVYQARMLDKQLRQGLKGIARDNQLNLGHSRFSQVLYSLADLGFLAWGTEAVTNGKPGIVSTLLNPVSRVVLAGVHAQIAHSLGMESKPSLCWSAQFDRYAMAAGYLATHRLIAPLQTA